MYFVTICTQNRDCLLGNIVGVDPCVDPHLETSNVGIMIDAWWNKLPEKFPLEVDVYQIMPNHVHGIISLLGRTHGSAPTIGMVIQWFKTMTTNEYIQNVNKKKWPPFEKKLWQRNYYEHVIRNEDDLNRIQKYIQANPLNWDEDEENIKVDPGGFGPPT